MRKTKHFAFRWCRNPLPSVFSTRTSFSENALQRLSVAALLPDKEWAADEGLRYQCRGSQVELMRTRSIGCGPNSSPLTYLCMCDQCPTGIASGETSTILLHVRFVRKFQMLTTGPDVCPFSMVLTMDGGFSRKGISVSQCGKS